jgi:hypothetical protein
MSAAFSSLTFNLGQLVDMIDHGSIGLPEIQRPFVWKRVKVRDLFDSMYRGFPVGYFLFWRTMTTGARVIGSVGHQVVPDRMIVDGQQRLTSLYSVLRGVPVVDEDYREERIEIAFNPLDETFAVTAPAYRRNRQWISDISVLWRPDLLTYKFVGEYIERLRETLDVGPADEQRINAAIARLINLRSYQFTAIELSPDTDAEAVADIFVRINSAGVELNQADFILTLMSVYWDEGRRELEAFSRAAKQPDVGRPSPFNYFIDPSPDQLLRVSVGYGFRRGRLRTVYNLLRGKELDSEGRTGGSRNFERLAEAQREVLNLDNWHQFLQCVMVAGFRSGKLITAANVLLYGYVLFLIGKRDFKVPFATLRTVIARWVFMSAVTSRYSGSYESTIESDLNRISTATDGAGFVDVLERIVGETLTDDFWSITLPSDLQTTAARSPALYAYYAALNLLNARVLFSPLSVRELFDPAVRGNRMAIERHHLFPTAHLKRNGYTASRDIDQTANFALLEWPQNAHISDDDPARYAPALFAAMGPDERRRAMRWHALPDGWEAMDYPDFLAARRSLMAQVVRDGFEVIGRGISSAPEVLDEKARPTGLTELIAGGESGKVEFKSTARWSLRDGKVEQFVEHAMLKTIAGFLNAGGGTLVIGVADDGQVVGLEHDFNTLRRKDRDGFESWLSDTVENSLGTLALRSIGIGFEKVEGHDVARVSVSRASRIVFLNPPKGPQVDDVYVRFGNSTRKLTPAEVLEYSADWVGKAPAAEPIEVPEGL